MARRIPRGAKPYSDREERFVTESPQRCCPSCNSFELDDVLPAHMDKNGVRFVERKSVEAAEQNVATSTGRS